jgi:DNA-binding HxlR family transcriptional regulator
LVVAERRYAQNCPIAAGLDILGERWTLLILRELLGGPRRYTDLRAELPGIASNLLAQRLRELEANALVEHLELPPPAARTVYQLTERGWQQIPPILRVLGLFGLDRMTLAQAGTAPPALTGFLAGILLAFDPLHARFQATYEANVDGRVFRFDVRDGRLTAASGQADVRLTASAEDLIQVRLAPDPDSRARAVSRLTLHGSDRAKARFRALFGLAREPAQQGRASGRRGARAKDHTLAD